MVYWRSMPIDLDVRAAIRHPDLGRVVQAVVDADAHDEADWIEWKSDLDLSTKKGCFPIARTILGMANRMPAAAALVCEGLGYIVVGAEPGNLLGVVSVDPADLDQVLEPWLGGVEGPRYTPMYVRIEGRKVLIVVVEAPTNGDPIYTLRKEFEGGRDGDVFVRKSGRTERANSADMKALVERAAAVSAATPDLEVSLVGDVPLSWFDPTTIDSIVAAWVGDRRRAMESAARAEERRRHPDTTPVPEDENFATATSIAGFARQQEHLAQVVRDATRMASVAGLADEPDKRTLDEYLAEVETWGERATNAGPAVLIDRYLHAGHGLVAVRVHNPSGRYLPKVMVEVHFEWDRVSSPEREYPERRLPAEPRPYGEPTPSALAQSLSFSPRVYPVIPSLDRIPLQQRSWTEEGSVRIVFDVGDLRQEDIDTSDDHYLFLLERPPDGTLHGTWKATIPDVHGVIRGTLEVPIREDPVELRELLDREPVDDDDDI
jgi:Putative DNA-binding domain